MSYRFIVILLSLLIITTVVGGVVYFEWPDRPRSGRPTADTSTTGPSPVGAVPTPSSSPTVTPLSDGDVPPIYQLPLWAPDIQWQDPKPAIGFADDKPLSGFSRAGTGISPTYLIPDIHPKIREELTKRGWQDTYPADAPGSSLYGYTKNEQGKQWVIYLQYKTRAAVISEPGEHIRFTECPCPYELTVFYSDPF